MINDRLITPLSESGHKKTASVITTVAALMRFYDETGGGVSIPVLIELDIMVLQDSRRERGESSFVDNLTHYPSGRLLRSGRSRNHLWQIRF